MKSPRKISYPRLEGSNIPISSKLSKTIAAEFVQHICQKGFLPIGKGAIRDTWKAHARQRGLRAYRPFDWYYFWSGVCMKMILALDNSKSLDQYVRNMHSFVYPEKETYSERHPMKRPDYLAQVATKRELDLVAAVLRETLVYAAAYAEANDLDFPSWYGETSELHSAVEAASEQSFPPKAVYCFFDPEQGSLRKEVKAEAKVEEAAILVQAASLDADDARRLAYGLLEAADYLDSRPKAEKVKSEVVSKNPRRI